MLDAAGDKPVTFRTLDIGGDKALPYMDTIVEENPALGWRAIRLGLDRPGLLRSQIRALLRAGGGRASAGHVSDDLARSTSSIRPRSMVERELTYLRQHGHTLPERVDVGTMVEVPALLYQLDELLKRVDFLSVGSNDLFQFLFAVDRGNRSVSDRFDTLRRRSCARCATSRKKANAAGKCRFAVRRDGLAAARRAGAARDGLSLAVAVGHRAWSGQGADSRSRCQESGSHDHAAARRAGRQRVDPRAS